MKKFLVHAVLSIAASAPALCFAQSTGPVTHAKRLPELTRLEKVDYKPAVDDATYSADTQAAEAKVAAQKAMAASAPGSGSVGGVSDPHSVAGTAASEDCVGPVSFCNIYKGG